MLPSLRKILFCCQFGVSSFVGEISSGVITVVFNMIILGLAGNTGVAAYGVVANTILNRLLNNVAAIAIDGFPSLRTKALQI